MAEKIYKKISKEEYEQLQNAKWERLADNELTYRTSPIRRYWRPAMAWLYFAIILMDFFIFPIVTTVFSEGQAQWNPITLQGGGLFHVAMSAIVASTAFGRSLEKMNQYKLDQQYMSQGSYDPGAPDLFRPDMGSPPLVPNDGIGDALSRNEDEYIPPK